VSWTEPRSGVIPFSDRVTFVLNAAEMAARSQLAQPLSESAGHELQSPLVLSQSTVDAANAQLLAWAALALLNQLLIVLLLPPVDAKTRALHQAYDFGQMLALGVVSWATVTAFGLLRARLGFGWLARWWVRPVLVGLAVLGVGLLTGSDDVANLADRLEQPQRLLTLALALTFALPLAATQLLRAPARAWLRVALALAGIALAAANALILKGDYFACHFMVAWLAALVIAAALEGLSLPGVRRGKRLAALAVATVVSVAAVAIPAKGDVRLRLFDLPSSVLPPLTAGFLSDEQRLAHVPARYEDSPWFRDRTSLPPVPPTRAIVPGKPPIVMFFTVDAFRADVMESAQNRRAWPELARLRKTSTFFTVARSPTASSMTTMASVFAGKYFSQLHWGPVKAEPLLEKTPRFTELLSQNGVRTLLVGGTLGMIYGKSGVARGFATEVVVRGRRPAEATVDVIKTELDASSEGPIFIYSHMIEPHAPYNLAGKKGSPYQRYLREIGLVDRALARLREYLEAKGVADRTYLIISADHGEAFGEHGMFKHARTAYEEMVRVPLFLYLPGREGQRLDTPVNVIDVGPTVLDLFGLPTPGFWMGQSLLPLAAGTVETLERPVIVDTGRQVQAYCFPDGMKVIFTRPKHTTEAFDLKRDPGELVNLAGKGDPVVDAAVATADLFFGNIRVVGADQHVRE
jgi:hypothetical protein